MADLKPLAILVRDLRRLTDAPLIECKRAADEADGDLEQAINLLAGAGFTGERPPYDPAERGSYGFEVYAEQVVEACVDALSEHLPRDGAPLTALVLRSRDGGPVDLVSAYVGPLGRSGTPVIEIDMDIQGLTIPDGSGVESRLLRAFLYRNGLSAARPDVPVLHEEPCLEWEFSSPPASLYCYEMLCCAQSVLDALVLNGFRAASDCSAIYAFMDYFLYASSMEDQFADVRTRLARSLPTMELKQEFAQLCYKTSGKQRWLIEASGTGVVG